MNKTRKMLLPLAAMCAIAAGCVTDSTAQKEHELQLQWTKYIVTGVARTALVEEAKKISAERCWALVQDVESGETLCSERLVGDRIWMPEFDGTSWSGSAPSPVEIRKRLADASRTTDTNLNATCIENRLVEYLYPGDYWKSYSGSYIATSFAVFPADKPRFAAMVGLSIPSIPTTGTEASMAGKSASSMLERIIVGLADFDPENPDMRSKPFPGDWLLIPPEAANKQ